MAVIEALQQKSEFTGIESQVADYVLAHLEEVITLPIAELAQRTYSSNATIIRLCHKVGMSGYREFRIALSREAERRLISQRTVDVDQPISADQSVAEVMGSMMTLMKEAIDSCYSAVSPADVRRLAMAICHARHVYICARGDALLSTLMFANRLSKLGIVCIETYRFNETIAHLQGAGPMDLALYVTYSGELIHDQRYAPKMFAERGCKTALISSIKKPFDMDLGVSFPHHESDQQKMTNFYSQACIHYILDCVYAEMFNLDFTTFSERKAKVDNYYSQ